MKLSWHAEENNVGEPFLIARDEKGTPYGTVGPRSKLLGYDWGWIGGAIVAGLPSAGPFRDRAGAIVAAQRLIRRHLFPDAIFGPIPKTPRPSIR